MRSKKAIRRKERRAKRHASVLERRHKEMSSLIIKTIVGLAHAAERAAERHLTRKGTNEVDR